MKRQPTARVRCRKCDAALDLPLDGFAPPVCADELACKKRDNAYHDQYEQRERARQERVWLDRPHQRGNHLRLVTEDDR